VQKRGGASSHE
jgi:hypothetical protein